MAGPSHAEAGAERGRSARSIRESQCSRTGNPRIPYPLEVDAVALQTNLRNFLTSARRAWREIFLYPIP
eukprot:6210165-Pleurochrysis_carterae.AAC.1